MSKDKGTPEHGKQYRLVGGKDTKSIAKGNTWAESEGDPEKAARIQALEDEGLTRSDAQGVVMAEDLRADPELDPAVRLLKAACRKEYAKLKLDPDAPKVEVSLDEPKPFTEEQTAAIKTLYMRASDGAANLEEFEGRFSHCIGGYVGGPWCGMHIGIENDGHTHS